MLCCDNCLKSYNNIGKYRRKIKKIITPRIINIYHKVIYRDRSIEVA